MTTDTTRLQVHLTLPKSDPGKPAPKLRAYLFDSAQRLVTSSPAQEKVDFKIDPGQRYRVTVGPDFLDRGQAPQDLARKLHAASSLSRDYMPHLEDTTIALSPGAAAVAGWLFNCVNVHGSVRKLLNPGAGSPHYAPIVTGTVQVFGIDLACSLDRLSSADLTTLKNTILSRMLGREIGDIITGNWGDLGTVNALAAGMIALGGAALKSYIVAHRAELAPFMCGVIAEGFICYEQYPDAQIQSDGTFSTELCFLYGQNVDLYFEVVQTVDGVTREVADPDIVCTTMFEYDGSQPAVVTVTDPGAVAGPPDPKPAPSYLYVWPTAIGDQDLRNIDGLTTGTGTGLLPGRTPWGGTLPLQIQFDPNLRANDIMYYRWSYRFDDAVAFTQVSTPVTHRWEEFTYPGGGVIDVHLHAYSLGPHLIGTESNLFEIPDPAKTWATIYGPADRPFGYFDSTDGTPGRNGMCTLKLEMFDAAGQHVSSNNAGPGSFTFLLPDPSGATDAYANAAGPNIDGNGDLVFRLCVDNEPTRAELTTVRTASHGSADRCGILHYTGPDDVVIIDYVATQPHDYLDWSLSITKGVNSTDPAIPGLSGNVSSPAASSLVPAQFPNDASVLLGTCTQAAFAVDLYCTARATNGYDPQSQYDRSARIAFALLTP